MNEMNFRDPFMVIGALFGIFFMSSMWWLLKSHNYLLKRKLLPFISILIGIFSAALVSFKESLKVGAGVGLFFAIFFYLASKIQIKFCVSCGATNLRNSWLTKFNNCQECGTKFEG